MLEAAPEEESGGNSRFTAGAIRVVYDGIDDMARVTQHRGDPDLVELLVTQSFPALNWLRGKGVRFIPIYGRQAFKVGGRFKFWGGLTVEAVGGGPGLIAMLTAAAQKRGI